MFFNSYKLPHTGLLDSLYADSRKATSAAFNHDIGVEKLLWLPRLKIKCRLLFRQKGCSVIFDMITFYNGIWCPRKQKTLSRRQPQWGARGPASAQGLLLVGWIYTAVYWQKISYFCDQRLIRFFVYFLFFSSPAKKARHCFCIYCRPL